MSDLWVAFQEAFYIVMGPFVLYFLLPVFLAAAILIIIGQTIVDVFPALYERFFTD